MFAKELLLFFLFCGVEFTSALSEQREQRSQCRRETLFCPCKDRRGVSNHVRVVTCSHQNDPKRCPGEDSLMEECGKGWPVAISEEFTSALSEQREQRSQCPHKTVFCPCKDRRGVSGHVLVVTCRHQNDPKRCSGKAFYSEECGKGELVAISEQFKVYVKIMEK